MSAEKHIKMFNSLMLEEMDYQMKLNMLCKYVEHSYIVPEIFAGVDDILCNLGKIKVGDEVHEYRFGVMLVSKRQLKYKMVVFYNTSELSSFTINFNENNKIESCNEINSVGNYTDRSEEQIRYYVNSAVEIIASNAEVTSAIGWGKYPWNT